MHFTISGIQQSTAHYTLRGFVNSDSIHVRTNFRARLNHVEYFGIDNGKEFAAYKQLEQALGIKVYFAKPYHSWERGTNENRNGVVLMVLPKGRTFDDILEAELKRIDSLLNDRPLRCLNWRTPNEAFNALLNRYLIAA